MTRLLMTAERAVYSSIIETTRLKEGTCCLVLRRLRTSLKSAVTHTRVSRCVGKAVICSVCDIFCVSVRVLK